MAKCPNWDLDTSIVVTNKQPAGIVRGYGGQELNSCLSCSSGAPCGPEILIPWSATRKIMSLTATFYTWRDGRTWQAHSISYVKAMTRRRRNLAGRTNGKAGAIPPGTSEDGRYVRGVGCGIIGNADVGEDNTEAYVRIVPDLIGDMAHAVLQCNVTESAWAREAIW